MTVIEVSLLVGMIVAIVSMKVRQYYIIKYKDKGVNPERAMLRLSSSNISLTEVFAYQIEFHESVPAHKQESIQRIVNITLYVFFGSIAWLILIGIIGVLIG